MLYLIINRLQKESCFCTFQKKSDLRQNPWQNGLISESECVSYTLTEMLKTPLSQRILQNNSKDDFFSMIKIKTKKMAEREGFEPSEEFPPHHISNVAPSTTQPSLRCVI